MILERIKEYIEGVNLSRLSAEELKAVTETAILIKKYNDDKDLKQRIDNDLSKMRSSKV